MRWLSRVVIAVLLMVGVTLVALFSFEQSTLRPLVEHLVETTTGRSFTIAGGLDASAGRRVGIRAGGISLGNAEWGSRADMLNIDTADISIDLLDLLQGLPAIDKITVDGVKLLFEEDQQGASNWALGPADASTPAPEVPASPSEKSAEVTLPVIRSQLSNIDITVHNSALTQPLQIHFDSVSHNVEPTNELSLAVAGAISDKSIDLQASIGPVAHLLDTGAVNFDVRIDFAGAELEAAGEIDQLLTPRLLTLQASLQAADIGQVFTTFGLPVLLSGESDLKASLLPNGDHHAHALSASIGALKIDSEGRLQNLNSIDGASIKLSATGPNLAAMARLAGLQGLPAEPFTLETHAALAGTLLTIGETRFHSGGTRLDASGTMSQFPGFEGTDLQLQLTAKNYLDFAELFGISTAGQQAEPFELRTTLKYSSQQQLFNAALKLADISGDFSGQLTDQPDFVGSNLDFRVDGRNNALLENWLGRAIPIEGNYSLAGKLARNQDGFSIETSTLSVGDNHLQASGTVGEEPLIKDTRLTLQFRGPDLREIAALGGYSDFFPAGDANIGLTASAQDDSIQVDSLKAQLGATSLNASGLIKLQAGIDGSRMQIDLAGEDIIDVVPPGLHAYVDAQQSFALTTALSTAAGQLSISALQASIGPVNLQASGRVSTSEPLADASLTVDAMGPDLAAIIPAELVPIVLPASSFSVSGEIAMTQTGLTLDAIKAMIGADRLTLSGKIPLDTPTDGLNLVFSAKGPNLAELMAFESNQLEFAEHAYEIAANLQLAEGNVSLKKLNFSTPQGSLAGELSTALDNPRESGDFDLQARGDSLGDFLPSTPGYSPAQVSFSLNAAGSWNSNRISVRKGALTLDDSSIKVQGEIDLPPNVTATRLVLSARGDDLGDLGQFRGMTLPADPFQVEATLEGDTKTLKIPALDARFGKSDLRGSLEIELADKPQIKVDLQSRLLDLSKILAAEGNPDDVEASTPAPSSDGRVIPQLAVPIEQLQQVNLEAKIQLGELNLKNSRLTGIAIDTSLEDGDLRVRQLQASATQGQLNAQFRMTVEDDRVITSGKLEGKDIVFGKTEGQQSETSFPKQDMHLDFSSSGATLRELAGNLNGYAQLTGENGRMPNSYALDLFGSFFSELVSTINPFVKREPYTTISCFAAYAEITDGVARINPGAVLQTDKLDMFARGQVNLKSEQIRLRFDTSARSGIGISVADFVNPFVGVSGTMAAPRLGVDSDNAMFEGGFAVATGGLSIIAKSLYSRWFSSKDPCTLLEDQASDYLLEKQEMEDKKAADAKDSGTGNQ